MSKYGTNRTEFIVGNVIDTDTDADVDTDVVNATVTNIPDKS